MSYRSPIKLDCLEIGQRLKCKVLLQRDLLIYIYIPYNHTRYVTNGYLYTIVRDRPRLLSEYGRC